MDNCHFDRVARSLAAANGTRRGVLRLLTGGVLGVLATRPGLPEVAEAKRKKWKRKRQLAHTPQDALQAAGKGKKKGKGKGKGKKKPKPAPACSPGQKQCGDGACILEDDCCPDAPTPLCGDCKEAVCENGEYVCRTTTPPPCGGECEESVCDNGAWTCRPMSRVCQVPQLYGFDPEVCQCVRKCGDGFCPPRYEGCGFRGLCESIDPNLPATCASNYTECRSRLCCRHGCCGDRCCPPPSD